MSEPVKVSWTDEMVLHSILYVMRFVIMLFHTYVQIPDDNFSVFTNASSKGIDGFYVYTEKE